MAKKTRAKEVADAYKAMYKVYEKDGQGAVCEMFDAKYSHLGEYKECEPCEDKTPHIDNDCQVCGTGRD